LLPLAARLLPLADTRFTRLPAAALFKLSVVAEKLNALLLLAVVVAVVLTAAAVLVDTLKLLTTSLLTLTPSLWAAVEAQLLRQTVEMALTLFFPHLQLLAAVAVAIRVEPLPERMAVQVVEGHMPVMLLVALAIPQALAHHRATTAVLVHRWQPRMAAAAVVVRVR
jgi:hypothetical protein